MKRLTLLLAILSHTLLVGYSHAGSLWPEAQTKPAAAALEKMRGFNHDELIARILNDMVDMKLAKDIQSISFTLTENVLEINNKKQPDRVLEKFKTKYKIIKGVSITYFKTTDDSLAFTVTKP